MDFWLLEMIEKDDLGLAPFSETTNLSPQTNHGGRWLEMTNINKQCLSSKRQLLVDPPGNPPKDNLYSLESFFPAPVPQMTSVTGCCFSAKLDPQSPCTSLCLLVGHKRPRKWDYSLPKWLERGLCWDVHRSSHLLVGPARSQRLRPWAKVQRKLLGRSSVDHHPTCHDAATQTGARVRAMVSWIPRREAQ